MEGEIQITRLERCKVWLVTNSRAPWASPALFLLAFAESIFFPIPVDAFLIPLIIVKARNWVYYAVFASISSVLGGIVGYAVGYFLFDTIGLYVVTLYGLEKEVVMIQGWLSSNAFMATFVSAFTPIPYKVFTITAGLFHTPLFIFIVASLFGRSLRYFLVCYIAHKWGAVIARIFLRHFTIATVAIVLTLGVGYAVFLFFK